MTVMFLAQSMSFIHPGIAAGALLLGLVPILIHLINRRRYVRVPWAAMSFLLAANRRSARRIRLERWLLLLMRVTVIVLFGLAVARPYVPASSVLPLPSSGVHRVLLIDNSLSTRARAAEGESRFDRVTRCAQQLFTSFPRADAVSVVTLSDPAGAVIGQATYDRRFVRERLDAIRPSQRGTDTVGAMARAVEILGESPFPPNNRAVYLISDMPRAVWESETAGQPTLAVLAARRLVGALGGTGTRLTVVRVAPDADRNVAVTRLATDSPLMGVRVPVRVVTQVTNHGSAGVRDVVLQFRRDDQILRREPLPKLDPRETRTVTITTEFSVPGTHVIEAKLSTDAADALAEDNTRYLSVEVRDSRPVLLVDGGPGPTRLGGQAGFLATAMAPGVTVSGPTLLRPRVITEPELEGEVLSEYDVIALCNVHRLPTETWGRLERFVADGGGLLVFGGDRVSTEHYNRFGYAEGRGLLPGAIKRAHAVSSGPDAGVNFSPVDLVHPIVAVFAGHAESGLFTARVERYLGIDLDPARAEVVLRYTDGEPALVASSLGTGRTLLCTTTANMDWTNLPAKGDYVSLMLNMMSFVSPRHSDHRNIRVGEMIRERLTPAESSLPLSVASVQAAYRDRGGGVGADEPSLAPDGDGLALEYGPVEWAGPLKVSIGSEARTFTANTDPAESDLETVDGAAFAAALDRPVQWVEDLAALGAKAAAPRSTELASAGLCLLIVLLLMETAMATWFGSQRGTTSRAGESVPARIGRRR